MPLTRLRLISLLNGRTMTKGGAHPPPRRFSLCWPSSRSNARCGYGIRNHFREKSPDEVGRRARRLPALVAGRQPRFARPKLAETCQENHAFFFNVSLSV